MKPLFFIVFRICISAIVCTVFTFPFQAQAQEEESIVYDIKNVPAPSDEARRYYVSGMQNFGSDNEKAIALFMKADSVAGGFPMAQIQIAYCYNNWAYAGNTAERKKEARKWAEKAYKGRHNLSKTYQYYIEAAWCEFEKKPRERIKWIKKVNEQEPNLWEMWFNLGWTHWRLGEYKEAVEPLEKALALGLQYNHGIGITIGMSRWIHHLSGEHQNELAVIDKIPAQLNDDAWMLMIKASVYLCNNETKNAQTELDRLHKIWKESDASDAQIASNMGNIYDMADVSELAEKNYREAISLEPEDTGHMNNLAYLLIDKDINVNEGVELARKADQLNPEDFNILDTIGWGLYKQGKVKEALKYLEKADELAPKYEHEINRHLKVVRAEI